MIIENLSVLKINKLTQKQYDRELEAGNIDENALYLTLEELETLIPAEYKQVEYIQSTGAQYIDTGFIPTINSRYELDVQFIEDASIMEMCNGVTGSTTVSEAPYRFGIGCLKEGWSTQYPNNWYFAVADKNNYPLDKDTNRHLFYIDLPNGKYGMDDIEYSQDVSTFSQESTIYLFARNHLSSKGTNKIDDYCFQKLYGCKIYEGGLLVRNFIPCYRKADDAVGLYDIVEDKFYENLGTGDFLIGNNIVE